jgi:F-type H+-transporting ATPase subunit alpha
VQYHKVTIFAQFGWDLDAATQYLLNHWARLTKVLKQPQYNPIPIEKQIVVIYAAIKGCLDQIPISNINQYEHELLKSMDPKHIFSYCTTKEHHWVNKQSTSYLLSKNYTWLLSNSFNSKIFN